MFLKGVPYIFMYTAISTYLVARCNIPTMSLVPRRILIPPRKWYKITHITTVWARTTTVDTTGKQHSGPHGYQGFPLYVIGSASYFDSAFMVEPPKNQTLSVSIGILTPWFSRASLIYVYTPPISHV